MSRPDAADVVAELRRRSGLSQAELAERVGMSQSAISDYERGRKRPSLATLRRLAESVGLQVDLALDTKPGVPTLSQLRGHRGTILAICSRHGASRPRVFGSVARGTAGAGSDVDLLVELEPGRTYFDLAGLHDDLVDLLGFEVDVVTAGALRGRLAHADRDSVLL